ncbi:MAG: hypothetical protein IKP36_05520 [Bacteroidaceae bacterium]|nr:hypothetical protein [Bacteroidaceae bacterium]
MSDSKLVGSINLAKLDSVGVMNIKSQKTGVVKKCVVIPIEENDIYIKVEEKTTQGGEKYISRLYNLGVEILEKRETDQWGNTCYVKVATSKEWIDKHTQQELEARNKMYLGNLKPVAIPSSNQASTMEAPFTESEEGDELPF